MSIFAKILNRVIMRRILFILGIALVTISCFEASAQQLTKKRIGVFKHDGNVVVEEASSTLVVDIVVEHEEFVAGPYARYAQKMLGTRASLVNRSDYTILSASVALQERADCYADATPAVEHNTTVTMGTSSLPIDRISSKEKSVEESAREAADAIFSLRRTRLDLITGEFGEGVFGAGLESALNEIARLESEYLELFYGTRSVSTTTERMVYPVDAEQRTTVIARFNPTMGLLSKDDLSGEIVLLSINPSEMEYPKSDAKGVVAYRYANNAEVVVSLGQEILVRTILPIYEFGETVMFLLPTR